MRTAEVMRYILRWATQTQTNILEHVQGSVHILIWNLICTPERRGGEKGGNANFETKHTEILTQEITSPLYFTVLYWKLQEWRKSQNSQIRRQNASNLGVCSLAIGPFPPPKSRNLASAEILVRPEKERERSKQAVRRSVNGYRQLLSADVT